MRTVDAQTLEPSVVPFYKASFVWLMSRQTTDYFLRVVVPLGFHSDHRLHVDLHRRAHFEAIVTIQVTALLSAVALYLRFRSSTRMPRRCPTGCFCSAI